MKAVQLTIGLWIVGASWAFQLGPRRVHVGRNYRHPFSAAANNNALEGIGAPSNPGWESGRLNRLTEWADSSAPNRPIICEYDPKGRWLWRKWRGTVLKATWGSVVTIMLAGLALDFVARGYRLPYPLSWDIVAIPGESTPFIKRLAAVTKVWEYQLSLSTFILTFFLSHAFSYWQKVYNTTRMIQGRINDVAMLITMGAERGVDDDKNKTGKKARSNASTVDPSHLGHGRGPGALKKELAALTGESAGTFCKNWKKSRTGARLADVNLSQRMWNTHKNTDGTLYNWRANMWVKVVSTERERLDLVGN